MSNSKQTKHKHPPTRRMIAVRNTTIDLGGGKSFVVKKGNIIKISKPYDGQAGRSVLVEPHGSVDGGHKGPSLFVANPADLAGVFKPMSNDDTETNHAYRAERGAKHATLSGEKTGRRSFQDAGEDDKKETQKEETEMDSENIENDGKMADGDARAVDNSDLAIHGTQYLVENAGYDYGEFLEFLDSLMNLESDEEYENVVESLDDDLRSLTVAVLDSLLAETKTSKAPHNPARDGMKLLAGTARYLKHQSVTGTPADAESEKYVRDIADRHPEKVAAVNTTLVGSPKAKDAPSDEVVAKREAKHGKSKVDSNTGKVDRRTTALSGDAAQHLAMQGQLGLKPGLDKPATALRFDGDTAHRQPLGTHVSKTTGDKIVTNPIKIPGQGRTPVGDIKRNSVETKDPGALRRAADTLRRLGRPAEADRITGQAAQMAGKAKAEKAEKAKKKEETKTVGEETNMEINENLASLARKQDAVNFADVVQNRLNLLAHEAIENLKNSAGNSFSSNAEVQEEETDEDEIETGEEEIENAEQQQQEEDAVAEQAEMTKTGKEAFETAKKHGHNSSQAQAAFKKEQEEGTKRLANGRAEMIKHALARVQELENKIKSSTDKAEKERLQDQLGKVKRHLVAVNK